MRRRICLTLAVLFVAAGSAVGCLWADSFGFAGQFHITWNGGGNLLEMESRRGWIAVRYKEEPPFIDHPGAFWGFGGIQRPGDEFSIRDATPFHHDPVQREFRWTIEVNYRGGDATTVVFPHWLPLSLSASAAWTFFRLWRRNRPKPGHCRACGYDLRAGHDRCPECGAAAAPPDSRPPAATAGQSSAVPSGGRV